jgi:diguanylate cyclase (GGDEF)-like protein
VNPDEHDASREIRRRTAILRERSAGDRLVSARERDETAATRDLAGLARDHAAAARDLAIAQRESADEVDAARAVTGAEIVMRAALQRRRATEYRVQAAEHRRQAAIDRDVAAADRRQGARDRLRALEDRESFKRALVLTETDLLTGARTRAAGLTELDHEIERCHRTDGTLVVAYVDAVGLECVHDNEGQVAGDRLLKRLAALIRSHVRAYDLTIRIGGDEFLSAMSSMTFADARERFSSIAGALAASDEAGAIRCGFAELRPGDTATDLIARADRELIDTRQG